MDIANDSTIDLDNQLGTMTDAEVRASYLASDGTPGHDVSDLLAGECERRNIDL